jgi:hypothetical protein
MRFDRGKQLSLATMQSWQYYDSCKALEFDSDTKAWNYSKMIFYNISLTLDILNIQ